jgi:septum formation protein
VPDLQLYLASRSPRRQELLRQAGLAFEVLPADIAEAPAPGQTPAEYAVAMALAKARAAQARASQPLAVLGADTDVVLGDRILGKPENAEEAREMLRRLAHRTHQVYSGVAVVAGERVETALSITDVTFGAVTAAQAEAYWRTGEPADKAGGYAIQGLGAQFVKEIRGSYSGVVGLPLYETLQLLKRFGIGGAAV